MERPLGMKDEGLWSKKSSPLYTEAVCLFLPVALQGAQTWGLVTEDHYDNSREDRIELKT